MKIFLAVFIIFIGFNNFTYCQIVLTVDDLPKFGDTQVSARVDSLEDLTLNPGNSGANVVWDFSMLHYFASNLDNPYDSIFWLQSTSAPNASFFPLANIAQTTNCYLYHNMISHIVSLICYHNYLIIDSSGIYLYGSAFPQSHLFQQYRNVFPLIQYGETSISYSREIVTSSVD